MCLAACFVVGFAVIVDIFCSLPTQTHNNNHDIPASLRTSSITATIFLASAPILENYVLEQRILLLLVLAVCALSGDQVATTTAATSDAIFAAVATVAAITSFVSGGAGGDGRPGTKYKLGKFDLNLVSLTAALLVYWSMRQLRTAFFGNEHALAFETNLAKSFAIVDEISVVSKAFCACVGGGAGVLLLANHDLLESGNCLAPFSGGLNALGFSLLLGATVQQNAVEHAATSYLGVLFGDDACGAAVGCEDANRARRFYACFTQSSSAFVAALAILLLAHQGQKRPESRSAYHAAGVGVGVTTLHKLLLLCMGLFVVVFVYPVEFSLPAIVLVLSIAIASDFPLLALLLHTLGVGLTAFDVDSSYFSHWVLVTTLGMLCLLSLGTLVSDVLYSTQLLFIPWVESLCAILGHGVLGMQAVLFLGSVVLPAAANGVKFETPVLFTERHFLTALFAIEFVNARFETVANWLLVVAFFLPVFGMFAIWVSSVSNDIYGNTLDTGLLSVGAVGVVVCWACLGWEF